MTWPKVFATRTPPAWLAEDGVGCSDDELEIEEADSQPALNGTTAPVPTLRVLTKAAESTPIDVPISAEDFRATKQRWTGVNQPLEHPLLAHTNNPEVLKRHMQYVNWQGKKSHVVLDRAGHIIGTLISPPVPGEEWASVVSAATDAIRAAREKMMFPAFHYCRAPADGEGFPTVAKGFLYGGGRQYVGNIKPSSQQNTRAVDELIADPSITCFAYGRQHGRGCFLILISDFGLTACHLRR
ncbi:hypothetical protein B0H14DRAFT_2647517 [Mycena olivaceomarginata]|nr:hypothetical protein B0H14DRAFT_2647517 [Mycena olivaceomarginata]